MLPASQCEADKGAGMDRMFVDFALETIVVIGVVDGLAILPGVEVRVKPGDEVANRGDDVIIIGKGGVSWGCNPAIWLEFILRSVSNFATTDSRSLSLTSEVILKNTKFKYQTHRDSHLYSTVHNLNKNKIENILLHRYS